MTFRSSLDEEFRGVSSTGLGNAKEELFRILGPSMSEHEPIKAIFLTQDGDASRIAIS